MPFDPYKPVESVLDGVASSRTALLRYLTTHPRQAAAAAAAALAAPFLVQNDERGYLQSSLITTPIVAAATVASPNLFRMSRDLGTRLINFSRQARNQISRKAGVPSWEDLNSMKGSFHRGDVFLKQYEGAVQGYVDNIVKPIEGQVNLHRQATSLRKQFRRYLKNEANSTMLANAVFAENYRSMSAAELAEFGNQTIAPAVSWRSMWRTVSSRLNNPDFVRGMNFRLQQMGRLVDPGGIYAADDLLKMGRVDDFGDPLLSKVRQRAFDSSPHFQDLLRQQRPELFHEIEAAYAAGKLNPDRDKVILSAVGTEDEVGKIAGVRIIRQGHKPLDIYVPQADGSVRMGDDFSRLGVSRKVLDLEMDRVLPADVYAMRAVGDDIEVLRRIMNKSQFGGYIDRAEDTFQFFEEGDHFSYQLDPLSIHARSKQVLVKQLAGIEGVAELTPLEKEEALLGAMQRHNLIKTWSENSFAKGVVEEAELSQVSTGGVYDPMKQARQLRGLKPIRPVDPITGTRFSGSFAPYSRTNYWDNVRPGVAVPEFGANIGGVSAGLKSLVGDLPDKKKFLFDAKVKEQAIANIVRDLRANGVEPTPGQAEKIWAQLRGHLRQNNNLSRVKKLGYLGEGDHLVLNNKLPRPLAEKTYYVHQLRLKDLREGQSLSRNTLLGFLNGTAITPNGAENVLRGYRVMPDGRMALRVDEIGYPGIAKSDAHTKGLNINTHTSEQAAIRDFLNEYGQMAGTGMYVPPDTDMLTVFHYSHNKANPAEQTLNIGSSLFRRLEKSGEMHEVGVFRNALEGLGFNYQAGTLVEDVSAFRDLAYQARQDRLQEAVDIVNTMMDEVGQRLRNGEVRGDQFLQHYAGSQDRLIDYVHKYASPVNAMMWNSVEQNVPQEASITYDMFGHLHTRGYHGVIKELRANSVVDGNIGLTQQLMEYVNQGDFSQPLGAALSVGEAVPGYDGGLHLGTAADRADTVFDPAHRVAASNYSIRLADGSYVPVLGHEAYGGKINRYGAGAISTNDRERLLAGILAADHSGNAEAIGKAKDAYFRELARFGRGKEGFLRAQRTDPHGLAGFIQTAPSSMGPENPFEVAVGSEMLGKLRDKKIKDALEAGEEVFAAIARHPVSNVPLVKVRVDRRLNPNIIGIDEGMRGLMMADDDGDIANLFFFNQTSDAHKEARAAVYDTNSVQHRELRVQRALEGLEDDSRLARETMYKSIADSRLGLPKTIEEISRARMAGAAVGRYSNILTDLMLGLETNSRVTHVDQKTALQRVFWSLRQAPIAAQKSKVEAVRGLEDAMKMANTVSKGLRDNSDRGFEMFYRSMQDIGRSFGKTLPYSQEMEVLGISPAMAVEGKINPLAKYVDENRELFHSYYHGRRAGTSELADYLTQTERAVTTHKGKVLAGLNDGVAYLLPSAPKNTGARAVSETLGALNEGIAGAVGEARQAFKASKAGSVLAAGLGLAAAVGVLSTSTNAGSSPEFSRRTSNAFRPEEVAGAQDHVPGEPVPGSMAPTNPPRRLTAARSGVRTALVAPVHQAVNLELRTKAPDRSRATEQARLIARMSTDGNANVTVNLRQGLRARSLRMREKMREMNQQ